MDAVQAARFKATTKTHRQKIVAALILLIPSMIRIQARRQGLSLDDAIATASTFL